MREISEEGLMWRDEVTPNPRVQPTPASARG